MDEELDELRREFLAEAEEKAREIESTLEAERSPERLERLAYLAHQLKGSGGSYGYQKISTDAAEIERVVETLTTGNPSDEMPSQLRQYVTSLRTEIEQRTRELAPPA